VGGQKSIQLGWPARSLPKTTQRERDTTRHSPTLPSRRTSPELDGLLNPYSNPPRGRRTADRTPVAKMACVLLSDLAPATTGEIVRVDGGYHSMRAELEKEPPG
jgi:Enoyl-(Acyl carrier protein) reductase